MSQFPHIADGGTIDIPATSERGLTAAHRAFVRCSCTQEAFCLLPAAPPASTCTARARDLSARCLGLFLCREIEFGALVAVQLLTSARSFGNLLAARVVHPTPQEGGGCLAGCIWVNPLGEDEFRALV